MANMQGRCQLFHCSINCKGKIKDSVPNPQHFEMKGELKQGNEAVSIHLPA